MKPFLSDEAIAVLWVEKLIDLAPRLKQSHREEELLAGDLQQQMGLDSLEIFELAAHFHGMFHLMSGAGSRYLLQFQLAEEWIRAIHAGANDWSLPMSFYTSGSTGTPKACQHDKQALVQEIRTWQQLLQPTGNIWHWVPSIHMYGFLFGLLLPDQLGLRRVDGRKQGLGNLKDTAASGDWMIGFPELYEHWLRAQVLFPEGLTAICSTAPLHVNVARALHERGLSVVNIYGSSESGGIGFQRFPQTDFQLLPYWQPREDDLIRFLPQTEEEIVVAPMDQLVWKEETRFSIGGRKDHAVQVGGQNVFPLRIANRMKSIPGLKACWVRKMNASEGKRLKAWIIPSLPPSEWKGFESRCYDWIEAHLSAPERPKHLILSASPPLNGIGKLTDWSILLPTEASLF